VRGSTLRGQAVNVVKAKHSTPRRPIVGSTRRWGSVLVLFALVAVASVGAAPVKDLWSLKPPARPEVPATLTSSTNPVDAFVARQYAAKGLKPSPPAGREALLRRVYLDLVGLPPSPDEQRAFLNDPSPDAYEKVVDRLLASEQHGVRYGRHWLDVLRYADADDRMTAESGIHFWRDWVIRALNEDTPYDAFVRAQLTGFRMTPRTTMAATGQRHRVDPRPDDVFALGFLSRGAVWGSDSARHELAISAVDTVSTAFMGMTVSCAKCHDHMFDPITRRDYYAMKALFDPLVPRKVVLASAAEQFAAGKAAGERARARETAEGPLREFEKSFRQLLYDERVEMLPPNVQAIIRKPENQRTAAEQKIADDYYPILRIDTDKIEKAMTEPERAKYRELRRKVDAAVAAIPQPSLEVFWTVEADHAREAEPSYILTSGDPERPETNHMVTPGWPFAPAPAEFREGRVEAFADWLTAPENPLFARVAVNRLWQWHFGAPLKPVPSDFGSLGGTPENPELLDWLASEFVAGGFSMKRMHRLIVTSDTYRLASEDSGDAAEADLTMDPDNTHWWRYPLQRLDAEVLWDTMFSAAGALDLKVGGASFNPGEATRRAAYLRRGFSPDRDVMTAFLLAFDVDDGRAPCPMRTRTVTPAQALYMMNSPEVDKAAAAFADRLRSESGGDLHRAVDFGFQATLCRPPSPGERLRAESYVGETPDRLKGLAWLLFNLDEFVYLP
jgi:Protein of unknown function (DUF1553)/Protein of unknown function (DUF1549)